ncbi:hypothetical protein BD769DRAFT_1475991 [Suillus cothurnatus]|nr:hypothetical protein BD769DRAFT_1475991 [Suillus cothurnatus]
MWSKLRLLACLIAHSSSTSFSPHRFASSLSRQHWRRLRSSVLLLLLSLKTFSIFWNSDAIIIRSPFLLFVLLYSSTWRLPMQLLSGKL